jgi:ABC-type Fe3+ transport system permease subunit
MGYGLLLFLVALLVWPARYVVRRARTRKQEGEEPERRQGKVATMALIVAMLTVIGVLVLSLLYRGPLGGDLVHSLNRGEPVLTKTLLGIFFSIPIFLVVLTVLVWRRRCWSTPERVQYTSIVLGALVGVYLLRDLWGLMFWG